MKINKCYLGLLLCLSTSTLLPSAFSRSTTRIGQYYARSHGQQLVDILSGAARNRLSRLRQRIPEIAEKARTNVRKFFYGQNRSTQPKGRASTEKNRTSAGMSRTSFYGKRKGPGRPYGKHETLETRPGMTHEKLRKKAGMSPKSYG
jgi:hypothetical protein